MLKRIFALTTMMVLLFGCKKDSDSEIVINTTTPSKSQLVGKWLQTAQTIDGVNTWIPTVTPICNMDDIMELKADDTYIMHNGPISCQGAPNGTGQWSINGSTLTINGSMKTVLSFNGKTLVATQTWMSQGVPSVHVDTFTRQ